MNMTIWKGLRTWAEPRGVEPTHPRTFLATRLAELSLVVLRAALLSGGAASDETPKLSKMRALPGWVRIMELEGASLTKPDSCTYGCPARKGF